MDRVELADLEEQKFERKAEVGVQKRGRLERGMAHRRAPLIEWNRAFSGGIL